MKSGQHHKVRIVRAGAFSAAFAVALLSSTTLNAGGGFSISTAPDGISQEWWDAQIAIQSGSQCQACHDNVFASGAATVGGKAAAALNDYGDQVDLVLSGDIGISIQSLPPDSGDIDGDGATNGRELNFAPFTFPGFASSTPPLPTAVADSGIDVTAGTGNSIAASLLLSNDTPNISTNAVTGVSNATNGSVSFAGSTVTFTPNNGVTTASFDYTMTDDPNGTGRTSTATVTLNVITLNAPPTISAPFDFNVDENETTIGQLSASEAVTWAVTGGADQASITIDASGNLTFVSPPDFENPADSDTNNVYVVEVTATETDGGGQSDTQTITVTVQDVDDIPPTITSSPTFNVPENQTSVATLSANDFVTWAITGGDDSGDFSINPSTGALSFNVVPDFEAPADNDGNNVYLIEVSATDGSSNVGTQSIAITVTQVNEAPTAVTLSNTVTSVSDTQSAQLKVADITVTDDAVGTNTLAVIGANSALFEVIGTGLFLKAGQTLTGGTTLEVQVTVDDASVGGTPDATSATLSISVNASNQPPTAVTLANAVTSVTDAQTAQLKVADINVSDDGLGTNILAVTGADAALFEIIGTQLFLKAGQTLTANDTLEVAVTADDTTVGGTPDATSSTLSITVTATNQAPTAVNLANTVTSVLDSQAAQLKVADITVVDDGAGTNTLALTGADAALFQIIGTELFLKAGQALTAGDSLQVAVTVDDPTVGGTPDATSATLSISIAASNQPPTAVNLNNTITSVSSDQSARLKVADISVVDDGLGTNALGLAGADAALFEITGTELFLKAGQTLVVGDTLEVAVTADDTTVGSTPDATSATLAISVTQANRAPTAVADGGAGFVTDEATSFTTGSVLSNDTDPDGDPLSVSAIDTTGTKGTVTSLGNGTFTYDPNGQFNGLFDGEQDTDSFTYTAVDPSGASSSATVTITISGVGSPDPVTTPDTAETTSGTPVAINVAANDTGGAAVTSIQVATQPTSGSASVNGLIVTYTPDADFEGQDTFTYIALSASGQSATTQVTITVNALPDFVAGSIAGATDDPRLQSTASALDDVCVTLAGSATTSASRLFSICQGLAGDAADGQSIDNALSAIGVEEAFAASDASYDFADAISSNLFGRMQSARTRGARGVDLANLRSTEATGFLAPIQALAMQELGDGLSSLGGMGDGKLGMFVSGTIGFGDRSSNAASGDRSFDTLALTAGVDYLFTEEFLVGVALSYSSQDSEFGDTGSIHEVDGLSYSIYGSLDLGAAFVEGHATYGQRNHDLERNIVFDAGSVSVNELAVAEFDGNDLLLGLRARVPFEVDGFEIDAKIGITYLDGEIDEYQETGADDLNLVVAKQSYDYFVTDIGARFAYAFENGDGSILRPFLDLEYNIISGRDDREIVAGFLADPLGRRDIFLTSLTEDDNQYFSLTAGLSATFERLRISGEYSTSIGLQEAKLHAVSISLSVPFGN